MPRIEAALGEAFRVLKHGGRFLCLEFSEVDMPMLDRLYELYSFRVIPALGRAVAGDAESYRYLVESIRTFPNQERFADMIRAAGFGRVSYRNFSGGIAALHFRLEALEDADARSRCGSSAPASCWPAPASSASTELDDLPPQAQRPVPPRAACWSRAA